jgi:ABC-2 type transport system ATP-binding protein
MIQVEQLTKSYGGKTVVDDVTFRVEPGSVTGFLGPNGAGKTTTMRLLLGLERPDSGRALIAGKPYAEHRAPIREVGVLLDARAAHPNRSARNHLRIIARTHGISNSRVDEVIGLAGLESVATKRAGTFSLGMGQRLGIAVALLGDPRALILDEPVNGLDPDGVSWIRSLTRSLADEGRAVLISSHLMAEMAQTADRVIVLGRGAILADETMSEVISGTGRVRARATRAVELAAQLRREGGEVIQIDGATLEITGLTAEAIAETASTNGILLIELAAVQVSLEDAFFELTHGSVEFRPTMTTSEDPR